MSIFSFHISLIATDTGWAYGFYYNLLAPLSLGHCLRWVDTKKFSPETILSIIETERVTNLAGSPSAFGMLKNHLGDYKMDSIEKISSAGEPLTVSLVEAFKRHGLIIRSHYGQTEHGMVCNNHWKDPVDMRFDAMGTAMPGFDLHVDTDGTLQVSTKSKLFWFPGYHNKSTELSDFVSTGDLVTKDEKGVFHYTSRADDMIKSSGYLISPTEIENVLLGHESVSEACVVGVPDAARGHLIAAAIVGSDEIIEQELKALVREKLGRHINLSHVKFLNIIPKTDSGKKKSLEIRQMFASIEIPGTRQ